MHSALEAKRSDVHGVMPVFPVLDKFWRLYVFNRAKPFFVSCIYTDQQKNKSQGIMFLVWWMIRVVACRIHTGIQELQC